VLATRTEKAQGTCKQKNRLKGRFFLFYLMARLPAGRAKFSIIHPIRHFCQANFIVQFSQRFPGIFYLKFQKIFVIILLEKEKRGAKNEIYT
jgi:hypothetical protein